MYPTITSADADELIGWGALSGLAAHPSEAGKLYAVNDSFYGLQPSIFEIDATAEPARITGAIRVNRERLCSAKARHGKVSTANDDGTFWIGSEGRTDRMIPHGIYHVGPDGKYRGRDPFPDRASDG